jgi:hypothetical protein
MIELPSDVWREIASHLNYPSYQSLRIAIKSCPELSSHITQQKKKEWHIKISSKIKWCDEVFQYRIGPRNIDYRVVYKNLSRPMPKIISMSATPIREDSINDYLHLILPPL